MWTLGFIVMISANLGTGFCKSPIPFDICRALAGVGAAMSCEFYCLPGNIAFNDRWTKYPMPLRSSGGPILLARSATLLLLSSVHLHLQGIVSAAGWLLYLPNLSTCDGFGGLCESSSLEVGILISEATPASAIFIAASLAIGLYILPPDENLPSPSERHFDVPGAVLLALALGLFNFCWNQASVVGWETVYVYVLLIVSFFTFLAFFLWERRIGKKALIPLEVLTRKNLLVYLCLWLGWMSYGIFLLYTILL